MFFRQNQENKFFNENKSKSILSNETIFFRQNQGKKNFGPNLGFWVIFAYIRDYRLPRVTQIFYRSPAFRIQVVCRNMNVTCLKSVSKTPTFRFLQGFPALKETVAHIQANGQFWTVFGQNGRNRIFFKKRLEHFFRLYKP